MNVAKICGVGGVGGREAPAHTPRNHPPHSFWPDSIQMNRRVG